MPFRYVVYTRVLLSEHPFPVMKKTVATVPFPRCLSFRYRIVKLINSYKDQSIKFIKK